MADSKEEIQHPKIKIGWQGAEIPSSEHPAMKVFVLLLVALLMLAILAIVAYTGVEASIWIHLVRLAIGNAASPCLLGCVWKMGSSFGAV